MKRFIAIILFGGLINFAVASNNDTVEVSSDTMLVNAEPVSNDIENNTSSPEESQNEKSIQQQAEEIPVVFGQWWFWVGLFTMILFLKLVIFKK